MKNIIHAVERRKADGGEWTVLPYSFCGLDMRGQWDFSGTDLSRVTCKRCRKSWRFPEWPTEPETAEHAE